MNRDQKAAAIEEVATQIQESEAVFAVDYRGISVPQAAELRTRLIDAGARFRVVKNTLTQRAADQAGVESLKEFLEGPTAFTFVVADGDVALAAKALATFRRETDLLSFKGGIMGGDPLTAEQLEALSRLPGPRRAPHPARSHDRLADHRTRPDAERADRRTGDPARPDRRAGPGGRRRPGRGSGGGTGCGGGSGCGSRGSGRGGRCGGGSGCGGGSRRGALHRRRRLRQRTRKLRPRRPLPRSRLRKRLRPRKLKNRPLRRPRSLRRTPRAMNLRPLMRPPRATRRSKEGPWPLLQI